MYVCLCVCVPLYGYGMHGFVLARQVKRIDRAGARATGADMYVFFQLNELKKWSCFLFLYLLAVLHNIQNYTSFLCNTLVAF